MHQQIKLRLEELNRQFEQGNARLVRVERERTELRETMLRIQGAILVLKEFPAGADMQDAPDDAPDDAPVDAPDDAPEETAEICIPVAPDDEAAED